MKVINKYKFWEIIKMYQEGKLKEGDKIIYLSENGEMPLYVKVDKERYFNLVRNIDDVSLAGLNLSWAIHHPNELFKIIDEY